MSVPTGRTAFDARVATIAGVPVSVSPWLLLWAIFLLHRAPTWGAGLVDFTASVVAVLAHELGHAIPARNRRLSPAILLHGLGGWCAHTPERTLNDQLAVVAWGPGAGLITGAIAWIAGAVAPVDLGLGARFLDDIAWMGLFWSVVNLLPILPLDGGQLAVNAGQRLRLRDPVRWVRVIGVSIGAVGAVVAWTRLGEPFLALLLGGLAVDNLLKIGGAPVPLLPRPVRDALPRPPRAPWRLRRMTVAVAATISAAAAIGLWTSPPTAVRVLAWPLVWNARPEAWVAATVAWVVAGSALEARVGWRGIVTLATVVTLGAGLPGALTAWATGSTLAGPTPWAVAAMFAWAATPHGHDRFLVRMGIGAAALVAGLELWAARDWPTGVAGVAAAGLGAWGGRQITDPASPWRRFELWWRLLRPAKIVIVPAPSRQDVPRRTPTKDRSEP